MLTILIVFWFASLVIDASSSALLAIYFYDLGVRMGRRVALQMMGNGVEATVVFLSVLFTNQTRFTSSAMLLSWRLGAHILKTATMIPTVIEAVRSRAERKTRQQRSGK